VAQPDTPWEPPLAASEAEHLIGALDRLRATFRWKADDLDAGGLAAGIPSSSMTLGGLLKHLAVVEDEIFGFKLSGAPLSSTWDTSVWSEEWDWPFTSAVNDTPADLYGLWDAAVERSRTRLATALASGGLDQSVHAADDQGNQASLRRILCDIIEEYGRHVGHSDLLREAVDGRVGEDPPPGWRPHA
jgi:hypothetical protein